MDINDSIKLILAKVAQHGDLAPRKLALFSLICKYIARETRSLRERQREMYLKWLPKFGRRLHARLIGHPIKYDKEFSIEMNVGDVLFDDNWGLRFIALPNFKAHHIPLDRHFALSNIVLCLNRHKNYRIAIIATCNIVAHRYVSATEIAPMKSSDTLGYVRLNIPGDINPLLLGDIGTGGYFGLVVSPVIDSPKFRIAFKNDAMFLSENLHSLIVSFKSLKIASYNPDDQILVSIYDGQERAFSFMRRTSDKFVVATENDQIDDRESIPYFVEENGKFVCIKIFANKCKSIGEALRDIAKK